MTTAVAKAQAPAASRISSTQTAIRRFPQPVRVGDLLDRQVLRPVESQPTVGRVRNVVRQADGGIYMVVNYGGLFGFFTRPIAVPVTAMALLGEYVEVIDFTPHQLDNFQRFDAAGTTPLPPDSLIDVGLIGPAH